MVPASRENDSTASQTQENPEASESMSQAAEGEACVGRIMSLPLRAWEDFIGPDGEGTDWGEAHLT